MLAGLRQDAPRGPAAEAAEAHFTAAGAQVQKQESFGVRPTFASATVPHADAWPAATAPQHHRHLLQQQQQQQQEQRSPWAGTGHPASAFAARAAQPFHSAPALQKHSSSPSLHSSSGASSLRNNADACRRTREKRKRETTDLRARNQVLERDRELYLTRIADLQTEVQALRHGGCVDLGKENDLLRAEIRMHKRCIAQIAASAQSAMALSPAQRFRAVRESASSSLGHAMGLAYTSGADADWRAGDSVQTGCMQMHTRFQLLPRGAPRADAKRLNVRMEITGIPCSMESVCAKSKTQLLSTDYILRSQQRQGGRFQVQDVTPPELRGGENGCENGENGEDEDDDSVRVLRISRDDAMSMVVSVHCKHLDVFPRALTPHRADAPAAPVRGFVIVQATATRELEEGQTASFCSSDAHAHACPPSVIAAHKLVATVNWSEDGGRTCNTLSVVSYPIGDARYRAMQGHAAASVDEKGHYGRAFFARIRGHLEYLVGDLEDLVDAQALADALP